jgi:hypothetical protein
MLDGAQRKKAVVKGSPGEQAKSVTFRKDPAAMPGILYADLSADQKKLVETVMRDVLSPYRKEDADEVMEIVKKNGGMEKIHLPSTRTRTWATRSSGTSGVWKAPASSGTTACCRTCIRSSTSPASWRNPSQPTRAVCTRCRRLAVFFRRPEGAKGNHSACHLDFAFSLSHLTNLHSSR